MFAEFSPETVVEGTSKGPSGAAPGLARRMRDARLATRRVWERLCRRVDPHLLTVLLLSLFPIAPLLQPGYMWDAHDARHDVYFVFELDRGIRDGILYPRWQPDFAFGYGYPFFNIYGPFASYLGEGFHLLGLSFTGAVKMVFALSIALSGVAMYGFVRRVMGRRAGLVAAVAFMVIPYHLVDVYVRAALAESVAYALVPFILWAAWEALHTGRLGAVLALAVSYALLIFTHPLTALLLTVVAVFYTATLAIARAAACRRVGLPARDQVRPFLRHLGSSVIPVAGGLVLGLGLSAFFLVPAILENRFVRVDQWYGGRYAWGGDFVEFFQLFSPSWGWGTSQPGPDDSFSFQLGAVPLVLALFAVVRSFRRLGAGPHRGPAAGPILFFAALIGAAILLMLDISAPAWQVLPLARLVQFPWRLLALAVLGLSFLSGAVFWRARPEGWRPGFGALLLVMLLVLGSLPYMQARMSERDVSMAGLMQFQQSSDEMTGSTAWVKTIPRWSSMADYYMAGEPVNSKINYGLLYEQEDVHARTLELRTNGELIEYLAPEGAQITFDTFYYPGWRAYLLDYDTGARVRELEIMQRGDLGLITVEVPAGLGRVYLHFGDTPLRRGAKIASWAVVAVCLALLVTGRLRGSRASDAAPAECAEEACRRMPRPPRGIEREER